MIFLSAVALPSLISFFSSSHTAKEDSPGTSPWFLTSLPLDIRSMAPWPSLQRDAVAWKHFQLWLMCGVVLSQPSGNCQHCASSRLTVPLHPAEQCWDPEQATPFPLGSSIHPLSHSQPGHSQSHLLRELNKQLGWYIPDKALFYSAKQCHTSYLTQIRSVAPAAL